MNECKIVQDLLPLYAEDLVSPETREFIDEHCALCEACEKLRSRAMEPLPKAPIDAKAYQKTLRRDTMKMAIRGVGIVTVICLAFVLLVGGVAVYALWEGGYIPLENSYESAVIHEKYGEITLKVDITDWDNAGFSDTGAGSVITESETIRNESTTRSSVTKLHRAWENIQLYWAPNGIDYLLEVDIIGGGRGYFIHSRELGENEVGKTDIWDSWYPAGEQGLTEQLLSLCVKEADFPKGWSSVIFSFYRWADDSETVTFIYETDNGCRGLVDFHYPSETITDID